jgi:transcriptional regulator with XRE-family HTH domain
MGKHQMASERQLAIECKMSQSTLNRFMCGKTDSLDFAKIVAISKFFGVSVSQLIGEAPLDEDLKFRAVVQAMQQMPEYKKDALVAASQSLIEQ